MEFRELGKLFLLPKKEAGIICKKDGSIQTLETFRNHVKTRVKPENLRVMNLPLEETGFMTAYDLWMQKIKRFEEDKIPKEKLKKT